MNCARGAALATRTGLDVAFGILERGMRANPTISNLAIENGRALGLDLSERITLGGMSDFGNVSHLVPARHFSTATWPPGVTAHTPEAVSASCQPMAFDAALAVVRIEAMTAIDLLTQPAVAAAATQDFAGDDCGDIPTNPDFT